MSARVLLVLLTVIIATYIVAISLGRLCPRRHTRTYIYLVIDRSGHGSVLVNGSKLSGVMNSSPFTVVLYAVPFENWVFKYWVVNDSITSRANPLVLRINANTSITAVFRESYCVLRVNGPRGYSITVNGTPKCVPFVIETKCGTKLTLEASNESPLNATHKLKFTGWLTSSGSIVLSRNLTLVLKRNESLTLNAIATSSALSCRGVLVKSEIPGATILTGAKRLSLPACLTPPVELEGEWFVPLNDTHGYWLAWYWIESNGVKYWWSYGLNGSRIKLDRPANVTLHYTLGLKELPYVTKVWVLPEHAWRVEKGICVYRVGNRSLYMAYREDAPYFLCILMLEVPREVGLVALDLVPGDRHTYSVKVGVVRLNGWYLINAPSKTFFFREPLTLLINTTCWISMWEALTANVTLPDRVVPEKEFRSLTSLLNSSVSFGYCPAFWAYDCGGDLVDWWHNHRGSLYTITVIDADYLEKTGLVKVAALPDTGGIGLYVDFGRDRMGWGSGRLVVRGVAP